VQESTVRTPISKLKGFAACTLGDSGFSGSLPLVAVVQPTDLRQRHDGPCPQAESLVAPVSLSPTKDVFSIGDSN
jgi:hypothetical protein